ncbi:hypothetical protein KA183_17335 [bacterium]|nr:hypothetical protein [bacterium]
MNDIDQLRQLVKFFNMEGCECDAEHWKDDLVPIQFLVEEIKTDSSHLNSLYQFLPARYPKLFEKLLLNFRWEHFSDTEICEFLPNPNEQDFSTFKRLLFRDEYLTDFCIEHGYLPFAEGPDVSYDRFCFDLNGAKTNDYPVVQIDHEEVLSCTRIGKPVKWADSFREFVDLTIKLDRSTRPSRYLSPEDLR